jgi:hypothetical protein
VRRSNTKRRVDRTLRVIYTLFAILIGVSGTIDLFRAEWKLAFIEYLIVAVLIPAIIVLRNRDRRERQMPVEEPPPRWY